MPPRKKKNAPPAPEPLDLAELRRYVLPVSLAVAIVLGGLWVYHMEGVAAHQRIVRRVAEDPALGPWFRQQKTLVENSAQNPAGSGAPVALWYGMVERTIVSQPLTAGSAARLKAVDLTGTELLAGSAGRRDSEDSVVISVYGHPFAGPAPAAGDYWIFSVARNADGNSLVHAAAPLPYR